MVSVQISAEEFGSRRAEAARQAAERGLSGLVVFSRGGTTLDYYGDVMYLANFHSTFPPISDAPTWAGRGHAALVLAVDGPSVLITDYLNDSDDLAEVGDVRVELRVPEAIGRVLRELELDGSALGLVGAESITPRWFDQLQDGAGRALDIVPADDILFGLRLIKSEAELALMRARMFVILP
jgi:Xaa-Pro dipeptidase